MNNITYELFLTMEKALRIIVHASSTPCIPADCIKSIMRDDDVRFIWCMIWSEESADALLEMVISQWAKIKWFSYASAWIKLNNEKPFRKLKEFASNSC